MLAGSWVKSRLALLDNILATTAYLEQWKFDYEQYWDDAFSRIYGSGRKDGRVGHANGPRTVMLPAPAVSAAFGLGDGLRITQTIKMPSQTNLIGQGGLMTIINCGDMTNTDDDLDRDAIHFGFDATTNHYSRIQGIRVNDAPRHGISTYKSAFGENTLIDDIVCRFCGEAGLFISGTGLGRPFKPMRIGAINFAACKYGLWIDGAGNFRSQALIDFVSGDNQLFDLIRVDGNPGPKTTALAIRHIKCEISNANENENVVNLRGGAGGFCEIGSIYQDCILTTPDHTATYRVINVTEDGGAGWKVNVGRWTRTDNSGPWDNELAYDDGTLQLTWADVNNLRFDSNFVYQYNSWSSGSDAQDGVDVRAATASVNLNQDTHSVNTFHKYPGKCVFNTVTNRPVWATGPLATDVWVDATGATAHTPI